MKRARTAFITMTVGVAGLVLAVCAAQNEDITHRCLYLPPRWGNRVSFYHSFENGPGKPEVNRPDASVAAPPTKQCAGYVGRGYRCCPCPEGVGGQLTLRSPAFSAHRPLTIMMWWRLDAPMKDETTYRLIDLRGTGYISSFVHGKGTWCALEHPTVVLQVYRFAGIPNHNGIRGGGDPRAKAGQWHHAALTVEAGSEVRSYRDGTLQRRHVIQGRLFKKGDTREIRLGNRCGGHPMTIDEVVIVDRALSPEEIQDYIQACSHLREVRMPVLSPQFVSE